MDFVTSHVIAEYNSNHSQKWGQICYKSVQLVRVSSFRNDLLQNPYFRRGATKVSEDVYLRSKNETSFWTFRKFFFVCTFMIFIFRKINVFWSFEMKAGWEVFIKHYLLAWLKAVEFRPNKLSTRSHAQWYIIRKLFFFSSKLIWFSGPFSM